MSKKKCEWEWKKLGDVCEFNRGLTYSKKDEVEHSSNCILRSNNIDLNSNSLCLDELKYINDDFEIPTSKYVKSDCILICMSNGSKSHLGKVAYIDQHYGYAFGGFMGLLCPSSRISGKFLHKILSTPAYKEYIKSLSDGANINNLKYDDLKEFEIPVPPLAEQERIVKVLDDAFAKIDKIKTDAETNLQNAKDLFQAQIKASYSGDSYNCVQLGNVGYITDGDHLPPPKAKQGVPFITISNIDKESNSICFDDTFFVPNSYFDGLKDSRKPQNGDVLYTVTGSYGIPVLINGERNFCFQRHIGLIRPTDKLLPAYLFYWILSPDTKMMADEVATGTAQKTVSLKSLRNFFIPLPPLSIQKQIVAKLDSLSEKVKQLESNYKQVIADCDELKKSILKKAFEGQL